MGTYGRNNAKNEDRPYGASRDHRWATNPSSSDLKPSDS